VQKSKEKRLLPETLKLVVTPPYASHDAMWLARVIPFADAWQSFGYCTHHAL